MPRLYVEGHNRKERMANIRKGPGTFVYDGQEKDSEYIPTPKLSNHKTHKLAENGLPVFDAAGRPVMVPGGQVQYDEDQRVLMGGEPEKEFTPLETLTLWGVEFPAGEPVEVKNPQLALKCRTMGCFEELLSDEDEAPKPKKRGRPKKAAAEADAE